MSTLRKIKASFLTGTSILVLSALLSFLPLFLTNGQSGWHQDELDTLGIACYLDWGLG